MYWEIEWTDGKGGQDVLCVESSSETHPTSQHGNSCLSAWILLHSFISLNSPTLYFFDILTLAVFPHFFLLGEKIWKLIRNQFDYSFFCNRKFDYSFDALLNELRTLTQERLGLEINFLLKIHFSSFITFFYRKRWHQSQDI